MAIKAGSDGGSPLIPDIAGITRLVCEKLATSTVHGPILKEVEEHFRQDGRENPTIEDLLTHIRGLRSVAGKGQVRGLSAEKLDQLDDYICEKIYEIADKCLPNLETPYHSIASWVNGIHRDNPVEVFTTNYDLLMEQAFEDCHVPYFDGFAGSRRPFFDLRAMEEDMLPPRWSRLWKLHGSINWYQVPDKGVFRGPKEGSIGSRRVIHPSHLKYQESRRMPYLAMIDRLRAFFRKPSATLIICGYSFRDEHINEVIIQGLEYSQSSIVFGLLFDNIATYPQAASLARAHSNLSLLAKDKAFINGQESKWIEKETESIPTDSSSWVDWIPIDPKAGNGRRIAKFMLGDFAVFGQFLQEIAGNLRLPIEDVNAK